MNVLFVCNQNQNRSKTAEVLFESEFSTQSAGLFNENPITAKQIEWADVVIVMEEHQRSEIGNRFPALYLKKQILSLDIPDIYAYGDPVLKSTLLERVHDLLSPSLKLV